MWSTGHAGVEFKLLVVYVHIFRGGVQRVKTETSIQKDTTQAKAQYTPGQATSQAAPALNTSTKLEAFSSFFTYFFLSLYMKIGSSTKQLKDEENVVLTFAVSTSVRQALPFCLRLQGGY